MHLIINHHYLKEAVNQVVKAVSLRTTIPILTGIKIAVTKDQCILTGSDADLSIQSFIPRTIDDQEIYQPITQGNIVLPAKYFSEIVKKLPTDKIEIEVTEQFVTSIRSGNSEFHLNGLNADEYPQLPELDEDQTFRMSTGSFKNMIRQTAFAVSTQESRPVLTGVLWILENEELTFVATDSHRLAKRQEKVQTSDNLSFKNVVIPGKSLHELQRLLDHEHDLIDIVVTKNQILVKADRLLFYSRLLEGTYPDTERIIPKEVKTEIVLDAQPFLQAIERASLLAKDGKHIIKLQSLETEIEVTSNTPEVGRVSEKVGIHSNEGEEVKIAFNAKYLLDALKAIDHSKIKIQFTGGMSPFVLKPIDDDRVLHLVLPVRTY